MATKKCKSALPFDTRSLLAKLGKTWKVPMLDEKLTIEVSLKLKKSLGRCIPDKGIIRLNHLLLDTKNSALSKEVLCHEAAHYVAFLKNGPNCRPHGKEWKDLLITAGYTPSVKLKSPALPNKTHLKNDKKTKVRYLHYCLICQGQWTYKKPKLNTICPHCKEGGITSKLTIKTNPQNNS